MAIDPENPVVKLCSEGMSLEATGDKAGAHRKFKEAWDIAIDDHESFIAAHYLARNQEKLEDNLKWNHESLRRALKLNTDEAKNYLPSLYLNLGKSYEDLGNLKEALKYYTAGEKAGLSLGEGPYADMIRNGLREGLQRMGVEKGKIEILDTLIDLWCERRDLRPLSFILSDYLSYNEDEPGKNRLVSALSYLSAARCLNTEEQKEIDHLIFELTAK